jgi:hypothetical protein
LVEIDEPAERDQKLSEWLDLPQHLYLELASGQKVRAVWDRAQVGDTRLSSVQYLKFPVGSDVPVALGCDRADLSLSTPLDAEQRAALAEDLS